MESAGYVYTEHFRSETKDLVEVFQRAGSRPASVAARPTRSRSHRHRSLGCRSALRRNGKHGELRLQLLALALRALGFLLAEDQSLELVLAFLADVLEDGHSRKLPEENCCLQFKLKPWVLRKHTRRHAPSHHGAGCAAATCKLSRA